MIIYPTAHAKRRRRRKIKAAVARQHALRAKDEARRDSEMSRYREYGIELRKGSPPTAEEIEAARTPAGGWEKETLAGWGVPWPPPRGWKKSLEERASRLTD
jgi:hypothetical protein